MATLQLKKTYVDEGLLHYVLPLIVFGVSFYLCPWYINLLLVVSLLLFVKNEYLPALLTGIAFYNIMLIPGIPFWGSLVTTFGALAITVIRIGKLKQKVTVNLLLPAVLVFLVVVSFIFRTLGEYYLATGIKSSLQIIFLLSVVILFTCIPDRYKVSSKRIFDKFFPAFIITYLLIAFIFYDYSDRFGGGVGAQGLALSLTISLCYFCNTGSAGRPFQFFLLAAIFLTGSRTYFLTASLILAYDYYRNSVNYIKMLVLANAFVIAVLLLVLLPFSGSRLDYTSPQFLGTLFGRFKYYIHGWELIKEHPLLGNGMGSILRILETWESRSGFRHYKINGDTTIVHNEYLRILIELGIVGLGLVVFSITLYWKKIQNNATKYILCAFLVGSLLENTLALYSTGAFFFFLLLSLSETRAETQQQSSHQPGQKLKC